MMSLYVPFHLGRYSGRVNSQIVSASGEPMVYPWTWLKNAQATRVNLE